MPLDPTIKQTLLSEVTGEALSRMPSRSIFASRANQHRLDSARQAAIEYAGSRLIERAYILGRQSVESELRQASGEPVRSEGEVMDAVAPHEELRTFGSRPEDYLPLEDAVRELP